MFMLTNKELELGVYVHHTQGRGTEAKARRKIRDVALEAPHEPVEVVILNYKKDGTPFWNLLNITPIMDEVGQVKVFLGTQVDVSDIVKLVERNATFTEDEIAESKLRTRFNRLFSLNPLRRKRGSYHALTSELEVECAMRIQSDLPRTVADRREPFEQSVSPTTLDKSGGGSHQVRLLFTALLLQILACQFDWGAVPVCLGLITEEFTLSSLEQGLLGSAQLVGGAFSSILNAQVIDWLPAKAKWCLLIASTVNSAACLWFAEASNAPGLIGARFMVGLSQGFLLMYTPLFVGLRFRSSASSATALFLAAQAAGSMVGFGVATSFLGGVSDGMSGGFNTVDGAWRPTWRPMFRFQSIVVFIVACLSSLLPTRLWDMTGNFRDNNSVTTKSGSPRSAATYSFCSKLGELCRLRLWVLLAIAYCGSTYWISFWTFWNIEVFKRVLYLDLAEAAVTQVSIFSPVLIISTSIFALTIDQCIGYEGPAALRKVMCILFVFSAFAMVAGQLVLPWIFEKTLWLVLLALTFLAFAGLGPIFLALHAIILPPHLRAMGIALSTGVLSQSLGGAMGTFLPGLVMQTIKDANGWSSVLSLDVQNRTKYVNATTAADILLTTKYREQQAILWRHGGLHAGHFALTVCAITTLAMWRIAVKITRDEEEPKQKRRSTLGAFSSSGLRILEHKVPQSSSRVSFMGCVVSPAAVQELSMFKRHTAIEPMRHLSRGGIPRRNSAV